MNQLQGFSATLVQASTIIGSSVVDRRNENLGNIKEIVIDPGSGRIVYAVVSFGGFLGMGEKLFAIPFGSFKYQHVDGKYILDIPREQLEAAPGFDSAQWPAFAEEKWNREVHAYYQHEPFWL